MTGDPSGSPERSEFEASGLDVCVDKSTEGVKFLCALIQDLALQEGGAAEAVLPVTAV